MRTTAGGNFASNSFRLSTRNFLKGGDTRITSRRWTSDASSMSGLMWGYKTAPGVRAGSKSGNDGAMLQKGRDGRREDDGRQPDCPYVGPFDPIDKCFIRYTG